jgi:hypothetical protein
MCKRRTANILQYVEPQQRQSYNNRSYAGATNNVAGRPPTRFVSSGMSTEVQRVSPEMMKMKSSPRR